MIQTTLPLWPQGRYTWPAAGGFVPTLTAYLHDDAVPRPAVVVVPGGAYCFVSPGEGEPVADVFFEKGYQTFVLIYTTNPCFHGPLGTQPLCDLARAVALVRQNAAAWHVKPDHVAVCGFSAGGHLAGSLAVHWNAPFLPADLTGTLVRPDAAILCYPVVTMGPYTHADSRRALLGDAFTAADAHTMSLEENVTPGTPPVFFWHTRNDDAVPVQNSLLLQQALLQNGVVHEMHLFADGAHGATLANDRWKQDDNGSLDTEVQYHATARYELEQGGAKEMYPGLDMTQFPDMQAWTQDFKRRRAANIAARRTNAAIALWPQLADCFLRQVWDGDRS